MSRLELMQRLYALDADLAQAYLDPSGIAGLHATWRKGFDALRALIDENNKTWAWPMLHDIAIRHGLGALTAHLWPEYPVSDRAEDRRFGVPNADLERMRHE